MTRLAPLGEEFATVLAAARTGAEWAWTALYRDLAPSVLGYLRHRGAADPDGLCGDVFLRVVRDLPRFEGDEAGFRSWVFVMTHHRLIDESRRLRRRPEVSRERIPDEAAASDVESEAQERLAADEIRRLFDSLPPAQRDVLLLRVLGDLGAEDIGRAVGRSPGAVRALQRRGLEALRRRLVEGGVQL